MPKRSARRNQNMLDSSSNVKKHSGKKHTKDKRHGDPRQRILPATPTSQDDMSIEISDELTKLDLSERVIGEQKPIQKTKKKGFINNAQRKHFASSLECMQYLKDRESVLAEMTSGLIEEEHILEQLQNAEISILERKYTCLLGEAAKKFSKEAVRIDSYADNIESTADRIEHIMDNYARENADMAEALAAANKRVGHLMMRVIEAEQARDTVNVNARIDIKKAMDAAKHEIRSAEDRADKADAFAAILQQELADANETIDGIKHDLNATKKDATEASQTAVEMDNGLRDLVRRLNDTKTLYLGCLDEKKSLEKKLNDTEHALAATEKRMSNLKSLFQKIGQDMFAMSNKIMSMTNDNDN
ncbi:hypothetical protein IW150_005051 [Coemansia sp. RSA 2607]|nr:hypothetical protein IW150_005051 [Coemansia sp. RSA 2607]KAJ2393697.1 hypothetical protein GGI05_002363 [Coemansia sp. RSA 2603]